MIVLCDVLSGCCPCSAVQRRIESEGQPFQCLSGVIVAYHIMVWQRLSLIPLTDRVLAGVADGGHAAAVRAAVNAACVVLSSDGGWAALRLAEAFGIPDHCLQAPIAFDWRQIGSQHLG